MFCFSVGHGRSEGERVQISSFHIYTDDVLKHIDDASADNGGLPIFIFGHSMASLMKSEHYLTQLNLSTMATLVQNYLDVVERWLL